MSVSRYAICRDAGQAMNLAHGSADYSRFRFRFRLRLVLGMLLLALLLGAALSWQIHHSYFDRENAARIQSHAEVQTIAAQVSDSMQKLHQDMLIGAAGMALMAALMLFIAHVLLHAYRRLELSKRALQESELRWKFALEGGGEGMFDWDIASNSVHFSILCKGMLGYADAEMANTRAAWQEHLHPDDQPQVLSLLAAFLSGKKPVYCCEYRMRCKDGSWKWILARGMIISRDAAGQALRMIGTHTDITERKQADQAQLHRIVEAAPDPMLLVGKDNLITFANVAAGSAFGFAVDALRGENINNLLSLGNGRDDASGCPVFGSATPPLISKWPLTALHQDGTEFPVEMSLSPFRMDGEAFVIASIRDVSMSKRAGELLEQSFARLRQLSDHQENIKEDERKRIAQDIHDDLGQNLLVLKIDVALLHARTKGSHPKLHRRVALVLDNIDATIGAVRAIMNDLRPATLELGLYPAVEWQLMQFERMTGIVCKLAPEREFELDEGRTLAAFRVLQEALSNVARHAEASEVEITLAQDESGFSMTVRDNGKGLLAGDRKKPHSFGLMGIRERIHALGGKFTLEGSPGKGTLLSVFIAAQAR